MAHGVTGITGINTKLERHDGTDYVPISHVFNIGGPNMSREMVDTTTFDSTGGYRDKIGGLRNAGTLTFTMNYNRAGYLVLKGDFETDQPVQYRVILPDQEETTLFFKGLVTEMPLSVPEGDRITTDVTIEISGKVDTDEDT